MSDSIKATTAPLIDGISQYEVDFVIPRVGVDLPLGIDPFLLFKSRDPELQRLHQLVISHFESGLAAIRSGRIEQASRLLQFPEAPEIGLGYTKKGKRGSGMGSFLTDLILETLRHSPAMLERGVRHIEELQLVSVGIGPDRVSDMTANIIKAHLIDYTQKQCAIWSLPLQSGVPVQHVYDPTSGDWTDGYFDLPVSPQDGSPILFVPRRIVRSLPWINYDDFVKLEFAAYLRAKHVQARTGGIAKQEIIAVSRKEVERVDKYIRVKEETATEAQPTGITGEVDGIAIEAAALKDRLAGIKIGAPEAATFQITVIEVLNFLFNPQLIDGVPEVRTIDGTERRDIIFTNDSDQTFWSYVRGEHSALFLMFEAKNTQEIGPAALNQVATYLGDRLGRLGFIVTRNRPGESAQRKAFAIYNDSSPRKIILFLTDEDLNLMLDMKSAGKEPMRHIQTLYRNFRTSVQ